MWLSAEWGNSCMGTEHLSPDGIKETRRSRGPSTVGHTDEMRGFWLLLVLVATANAERVFIGWVHLCTLPEEIFTVLLFCFLSFRIEIHSFVFVVTNTEVIKILILYRQWHLKPARCFNTLQTVLLFLSCAVLFFFAFSFLFVYCDRSAPKYLKTYWAINLFLIQEYQYVVLEVEKNKCQYSLIHMLACVSAGISNHLPLIPIYSLFL